MKVSHAWYVIDVPPSGMQVAANELLERRLRFDLLPWTGFGNFDSCSVPMCWIRNIYQ
ncbi:hypothetical protein COCVIDRAFT_103062 [Bipolaris victoriae FI3]|uniref:Uncharacterized protein n=1 Tax=Bipolaris victoriae (strain FI3) TaxID=930091 RepID=W7EIC0_BIPV3|nr:hypothetical protein COCVIDRAFT_103062 [Bipolaris victoriae FI3]